MYRYVCIISHSLQVLRHIINFAISMNFTQLAHKYWRVWNKTHTMNPMLASYRKENKCEQFQLPDLNLSLSAWSKRHKAATDMFVYTPMVMIFT